MPDARTFDPYALLGALERRRVAYVVIGAFARVIHGADELTDGLDIVPSLRGGTWDASSSRWPISTLSESTAASSLWTRTRSEPNRSWSSEARRARSRSFRSRRERLGDTTTFAVRRRGSRSARVSARRSLRLPISPGCSRRSGARKTSRSCAHSDVSPSSSAASAPSLRSDWPLTAAPSRQPSGEGHYSAG
jgi:hypothetical protein